MAASWDTPTPQGYVYKKPNTVEELNSLCIDVAQAAIEVWDPAEHPPEPTWEEAAIALDEVQRLRYILHTEKEKAVEQLNAFEAYVAGGLRISTEILTRARTTVDTLSRIIDLFDTKEEL